MTARTPLRYCFPHARGIRPGFLFAAVVLIAWTASAADQRGAGQAAPSAGPAAVSPRLAGKLTAPFSSAATAKPLRESLTHIAAISQINLWIDRRVDPNLPVTIPAGSKSVFEAIAQAAQSVGLDAAAAGNVVLVGRREWVISLAGSILALPPQWNQPTRTPPIDWPALTTPSQALKIATDSDLSDTLALPHDLWPAVSWRDVSPELAVLLITAQFDLMPIDPNVGSILERQPSGRGPIGQDRLLFSRDGSIQRVETSAEEPTLHQQGVGAGDATESASEPASSGIPAVGLKPLQAPERLVCLYPNGPHVPQLRQAATAADPQSRFRSGPPGAPLELTGAPAAHAAATAAYLRHTRSEAAGEVDPDGLRFTLRLRDAPARDVFAQLATTAGKELRITSAASTACHDRVTLEGRDVTLRELTRRVASEVGVRASWTTDSLLIDLPR